MWKLLSTIVETIEEAIELRNQVFERYGHNIIE